MADSSPRGATGARAVIPYLRAPGLQQAADDILERMNEPETADLVVDLAIKTSDPVHQRELFALLARRLAGGWNPARDRPKVLQLIQLRTRRTRRRVSKGLRWRARRGMDVTGGRSRASPRMARHPKKYGSPPWRRSALFASRPIGYSSNWSRRCGASRARIRLPRRRCGPWASTPGRGDDSTDLLTGREYPLGLRREALRSVAQLRDGGSHVIELARAGKLPEDLKTEATTLLYTSPDRRLREQASSVLPLPKNAAGRPLPSIFELIRRDGNAEKGRAVFFAPAPIRAGAATGCRGTDSGSGRTCRRSGSSTARTS